MASFSGLGSSSSLPCIYVRLVHVNTIWTSVCFWITHDRYKIKAIDVSWPIPLQFTAVISTIFCLPTKVFLFSFSMKPKSIYFSRKNSRSSSKRSRIGPLLAPFWTPILDPYLIFPPRPTSSRVLAFQSAANPLKRKPPKPPAGYVRFSDYDLVIISVNRIYSEHTFLLEVWISVNPSMDTSWFEKIIESFLCALKHLTS